ncbi:MAG TPA: cobalamin-dependent protein [Polyangiales bacterium]
MKVRFVYAKFTRHAEDHPELREHVPCNEYFGPPSLGIAMLAGATPSNWEIDFRDDRLEDVGLDDPDIDLVAISCFTPSSMRAMELADAFRARGKQVVMGGIFPTLMPDLAGQHADALVLGEGEAVWPQVLADAAQHKLASRYRAEKPIDPKLLPLPRIDLYMEKEGRNFSPDDYPVQISRGCPLACTACAIPKSMGPRMRYFPLDHTLGQIDQLVKRGKLGSFTEDTSFFATPRKHFAELLDALAARDAPAPISYIGISMPMILATPNDFFAKMRKAGVKMFYLVGGFDPITQGAFTGKNPKALADAYAAIAKCWEYDIEPYTSFLVGNDDDDLGCFDRILEFGDRAKIRKTEFAIRTPYPGTPSYIRLLEQGRLLHQNFSRYNDANVVFKPAQMTPDQLLQGYLRLWREFYVPRQKLLELDKHTRTIQF